MRKTILFLAILVMVGLVGCRAETGMSVETTAAVSTPVETEALPLPAETEPAKMEWNTPERKAFQQVLQTVYEQQYLPELGEQITITEPDSTIEDEKFAILDVDGDGREELLLRITNTYVAGMCEVIYGFDTQTGTLQVEAWNHIAVTHYPGFLRANASHNHGLAGDLLWPYTVLLYDPAEDSYRETYYVDAWDKSRADYNRQLEMAFPEDIDSDNYGCVFLITQDNETQILSLREFDLWESRLFAGKDPIEIPWQKMTRAAIFNV